jgi:hypothetical protein
MSLIRVSRIARKSTCVFTRIAAACERFDTERTSLQTICFQRYAVSAAGAVPKTTPIRTAVTLPMILQRKALLRTYRGTEPPYRLVVRRPLVAHYACVADACMTAGWNHP